MDMILPQPELKVSKTPSPLSLDKRPIIKATIIIQISITILFIYS